MLIAVVALVSQLAQTLEFPLAALALQSLTVAIFVQRVASRGLFLQDVPSVLGVAVSAAQVSYSAVFAWILLIVGVVLGIVIPPEHAALKRPRGPFVVGTRDGVWGDAQQHFRVWYPAVEPNHAEPTPYFAWDAHSVGMASFVQMPHFLFQHLHLTRTHTTVGAPPASAVRKPLVIFSHGLGGIRSTYSALCADLASHGYVVVAPEHQDATASVTKAPDGSLLQYARPTPAQIANNDNFEMRHRQLLLRRGEVAEWLQFIRSSSAGDEAVGVVRKLADVERVHMAGHSFGGCTTIDCVAALNASHGFVSGAALDSWMHPLGASERGATLTLPTLMLNTDLFQWKANVDQMFALCKRSAAASVVGFVPRTGHQSVSDFPQFMRLGTRLLGHVGNIDAETALNAYADAMLRLFEFAERDARKPSDSFAAELDPQLCTIQCKSF
jgi:dienelactone hydrolase